MDPERTQWLERLALATRSAIDRLGAAERPDRGLLEDLEALDARLRVELEQ